MGSTHWKMTRSIPVTESKVQFHLDIEVLVIIRHRHNVERVLQTRRNVDHDITEAELRKRKRIPVKFV